MSEPEAPAPHRSGRRKARKYALDVLFAADLQGVDPVAILAQGLVTTQAKPPAYTAEIVEGVWDGLEAIDALIAARLKPGWTVARMPAIDRALARIALWEAMAGVPADVAIAEAAALAQELSTEASAGFLSGVLGAVVKDLPAAPEPEPDDMLDGF